MKTNDSSKTSKEVRSSQSANKPESKGTHAKTQNAGSSKSHSKDKGSNQPSRQDRKDRPKQPSTTKGGKRPNQSKPSNAGKPKADKPQASKAQKPKNGAPSNRKAGVIYGDLRDAMAIDKVSLADDQYQYDLCVRCWCGIVEDVCGHVLSYELRHAIQTIGLFSCIESADTFAKATLAAMSTAAETQTQVYLNVLWGDIIAKCIDGSDTHLESGELMVLFGGDADIATAACCQLVLRFPKRFTITKPDISGSISKFKSTHRDTLSYGWNWSRWPGQTIMEHLRRNLREILIPRNKKVYERLVKAFEKAPGTFSSGSIYLNQAEPRWNPRIGDASFRCQQCMAGISKRSCKECNPAKPRKWEYISEKTSSNPDIKWGALGLDSDYLYEHSDLYGYYPPVSLPRTKYVHYMMNVDGHMKLDYPCYRKRDVLVSAVPKDYAESRMIAPETAFLNVQGGRVRDLLISLATATGAISYMPPEDQSLNRDRAREGSYYPQDNPYVTYDLSHASDSISREFFFAIWPIELRAVTRDALSDYMNIDGKLYKVGMLATSGSRLTPILQSCFFLAILWTACDLAGEPRDVSVYNDDLICRRNVAETAAQLLKLCGCTVNDKKSFVDGPFRESCGGEYLNGFDVTGVYWPRHAIRKPGSKTSDRTLEWLQTISSMQHKLYCFPTTRQILEREVLSVIPDMTYSPVASECDDLWARWIDEYQSMRLEHYCIVSQEIMTEKPRDPLFATYEKYGMQLNEFYSYTEWLRKGPQYEDALLELLGISQHTRVRPGMELYQQLVRKPAMIRTKW